MDKVKLPKEVAEQIQGQMNDDWNPVQIMRQAVRREMMTKQNELICAFASNDLGLETLMHALVNGFEIVLSKEDQVREVIKSYTNGAVVSEWVIDDIKKIYEGVNT